MAEAVLGHHEGLVCADDAEAVALQLCLFLLPRLACLPDRPNAEGSDSAAAAALPPLPGAEAVRGCSSVIGGAANPTQTDDDGEARAVLACAAALQALLTARPQLLAAAAERGGGAGLGSGPVEGPSAASARLVAAARALYARLSRVVAAHAAAAAMGLTRVRARVQLTGHSELCGADILNISMPFPYSWARMASACWTRPVSKFIYRVEASEGPTPLY